jgi:hypothetical protein
MIIHVTWFWGGWERKPEREWDRRLARRLLLAAEPRKILLAPQLHANEPTPPPL